LDLTKSSQLPCHSLVTNYKCCNFFLLNKRNLPVWFWWVWRFV